MRRNTTESRVRLPGNMGMETVTQTTALSNIQPMTDINGLRMSGIFPKGKEPSIRTLREWTKRRRIPFHRLGHFVYYDIVEVAMHIRTKLLVPARN